jgi:hypothetical protein
MKSLTTLPRPEQEAQRHATIEAALAAGLDPDDE